MYIHNLSLRMLRTYSTDSAIPLIVEILTFPGLVAPLVDAAVRHDDFLGALEVVHGIVHAAARTLRAGAFGEAILESGVNGVTTVIVATTECGGLLFRKHGG
jgi:hypothetical protein